MIPKSVIATIIIVVIETVEGILVAVPQSLVDECQLCSDAWMELVRILAVTHEEHIVDERVQTVTNPLVVIGGLAGKCRLNLALSVKLGTHNPNVVMTVLQESVAHTLSMRTKHTVNNPVGDEWLSEEILLPFQAVALNLLAAHTECW